MFFVIAPAFYDKKKDTKSAVYLYDDHIEALAANRSFKIRSQKWAGVKIIKMFDLDVLKFYLRYEFNISLVTLVHFDKIPGNLPNQSKH